MTAQAYAREVVLLPPAALKTLATDTKHDILTVNEVATRWRISRTTVYALIRDGLLKTVTFRTRRAIRVPLSEVLRYEAEHLN